MFDKKLTPEMKAFMLDLADVLEKHKAQISTAVMYVPYCADSSQVELCCGTYFETEQFELEPHWLRHHVENN